MTELPALREYTSEPNLVQCIRSDGGTTEIVQALRILVELDPDSLANATHWANQFVPFETDAISGRDRDPFTCVVVGIA